MSDNINHPAHYNQNGIECIEVIRAAIGDSGTADFCMGCAIKYLYRARHKGHEIEDIQKANWYLAKYVELRRSVSRETKPLTDHEAWIAAERQLVSRETTENTDDDEALLQAFRMVRAMCAGRRRTRADAIRSMNNTELARFLVQAQDINMCGHCPHKTRCDSSDNIISDTDCAEGVKAWLEQEADL